jgi:ribonuclease HII
MQDELPKISGLLAGADEAGRGPLVGNVVAAAVILDEERPIEGLADSKKLTAKRRESLAEEIMQKAKAWAVVSVSPVEIDRINILQASMLAMKQAVEQLSTAPDHVFIDGNRCPEMDCPATAIVKGDARVAEISAASILAKVTRDEQMLELHNIFPQYGFDKHKGYPTKAHMEALAEHGPCPEHRRSYAPVRKYLDESSDKMTANSGTL